MVSWLVGMMLWLGAEPLRRTISGGSDFSEIKRGVMCCEMHTAVVSIVGFFVLVEPVPSFHIGRCGWLPAFLSHAWSNNQLNL